MDEAPSLHIVVFPWLAFGHIIPFFELSKSLAKRGNRISFLSTPRNLHRLPKIPSHLSPLIHLIPLPLPPTDGLPPDAEATIDLPFNKIQYLKKSFDGLEKPFSNFLHEVSPKPDWIIQDFAQYWAPAVASKIGTPCAFFSVFLASHFAFMGSPDELKTGGGSRRSPEQFTVPPEWIPFSSKVACRLYEARKLTGFYKVNASGISDANRLMLTYQGCSILAPRNCREFESNWLCLLGQILKMPVVPVGLLPPSIQDQKDDDDDHHHQGNDSRLFEWLDRQSPRSVVYVAFGSEATLDVDMLHELALGLEQSKMPFLWAFRNPSLPEGFEDRTRGKGIVATDWIPQVKVLGHGSVGGFLTHCGWSSIVEGLYFGHPFIFLPISVDQGLIARAMGERKIGVEVERNEEDGSFSREAVAMAVRLVMGEEEGEGFRFNAKEMTKVFADEECHGRYVDDFVNYLKDHRGFDGVVSPSS